jgi:hypothetical protein
VAFSSAAISSLHIRLTSQAVSKHGSFALTSLDKGSGFRLLYAVPPPIYIHGAQSAWRESNKALRHHILTGTAKKHPPCTYVLRRSTLLCFMKYQQLYITRLIVCLHHLKN